MDGEPTEEPDDLEAAADRLLAKVRDFVETLDDDERQLLAALLAPGVAAAYPEADVVGFSAAADAPWRTNQLPNALARRIREGRLRIEAE